MSTIRKTAVLLVNLGSPDSPKPSDVASYLTEFLNDPRVIDINWIGRKILVNGIIVPFRHRKSAKVYKELWTPEGSPLIYYGRQSQKKLQERFGGSDSNTRIFLAMRYKNPSIESALAAIMKWNPDKIIVLPLFPHYASASTGSVIDKCMRIMRDMWAFPEIQFVNQFWDHPLYLQAFANRAKQFDFASYDHIIFDLTILFSPHLNLLFNGYYSLLYCFIIHRPSWGTPRKKRYHVVNILCIIISPIFITYTNIAKFFALWN